MIAKKGVKTNRPKGPKRLVLVLGKRDFSSKLNPMRGLSKI